jgi:hypothetical protein
MLGPMPSDNEVRPGTLGRDYGDILWQPGPEVLERARITAYRRWLGAERGIALGGGTGPDAYRQLHHWSVTEPGPFWDSLWDYFGIAGERGDGPVLTGGQMPDITWLPDGGCVIFGRSDATLNRGGVRMGTSEFYRVVEQLPEVADSLVVDTGQLGTDGRLILYLVLADGAALDDDLAGRIKAALRAALSPRHVPDEIHQVPGIPRTLSGKKLEVPVRRILLGTPVADAADPDALANPEVLAWFGR